MTPPPTPDGRLVHEYGEHVHILSDAWARTLTARMGHPDTSQLMVHHLLELGFARLLQAASEQLPIDTTPRITRMTADEPRAQVTGDFLSSAHPVVVVDIARGGMIPSHVLQKGLIGLVDEEQVRVDHIYMQRVTDPESGHVTGVQLSGSKIGGPVADATVFVPDPMAATGSSAEHVLEHYLERMDPAPRKVVTCHLIVTPEYLRRITRRFPHVHVYALRLDRGLSPDDVLATVPGRRWDEERGLNDHDYIVPGAGGLGELINNSWV